MRLFAVLQQRRSWSEFCAVLGANLQQLTGAERICLVRQDYEGRRTATQLIGPPMLLPADLPERVGEVRVADAVSSVMLHDGALDSTWILFHEPGRWNLAIILPAIAPGLGRITANVFGFDGMRVAIRHELNGGGEALAAMRRSGKKMLGVLLRAATAAADGPQSVFLSRESGRYLTAWIGAQGELATAPAGDEVDDALGAERRQGRAIRLAGSAARALARQVEAAEGCSFYFEPIDSPGYVSGLLGLAVGTEMGKPTFTARPLTIGDDLARPQRISARTAQALQALTCLRMVRAEAASLLHLASAYQDGYSFGVREERENLGIDLHDSVLQDLSYIHLQLGRLEQRMSREDPAARTILDQTTSMIATASRETRELAIGLTQTYESLDLAALCQPVVERFRGRFEGDVRFLVVGVKRESPLRPNGQIVRILQELLSNVLKHAAASSVDVELRWSGSSVQLTVADNGRGFALEDRPPTHLGLRGIQRRVERLDAQLDIDSEVGRGTTVRVEVPID